MAEQRFPRSLSFQGRDKKPRYVLSVTSNSHLKPESREELEESYKRLDGKGSHPGIAHLCHPGILAQRRGVKGRNRESIQELQRSFRELEGKYPGPYTQDLRGNCLALKCTDHCHHPDHLEQPT